MEYEGREKLKLEGWNLLDKHEHPNTKCNIFMHYIIKSHYWRARLSLENSPNYAKNLMKIRGKNYYRGYELDIDHYTEHWLFANKHLMDDETYKIACKQWYTPKESKYLKQGCTIYFCEEQDATP